MPRQPHHSAAIAIVPHIAGGQYVPKQNGPLYSSANLYKPPLRSVTPVRYILPIYRHDIPDRRIFLSSSCPS